MNLITILIYSKKQSNDTTITRHPMMRLSFFYNISLFLLLSLDPACAAPLRRNVQERIVTQEQQPQPPSMAPTIFFPPVPPPSAPEEPTLGDAIYECFEKAFYGVAYVFCFIFLGDTCKGGEQPADDDVRRFPSI